MPRHIDPKSGMSYRGICKVEDEKHHRIDLKYYPVDQYAYAILYFTGSNMFNRSMRLFAMKKGFCLSDHGMCRAEKIAGNIVSEGPNIECYTEEEIFDSLGIKYKSPV
jgi:DNA polymerase/3'-5' exonuclease PolX